MKEDCENYQECKLPVETCKNTCLLYKKADWKPIKPKKGTKK